MNTYQKQFLITVLAGVTTMAVWELYVKPKITAKTQEPANWWERLTTF